MMTPLAVIGLSRPADLVVQIILTRSWRAEALIAAKSAGGGVEAIGVGSGTVGVGEVAIDFAFFLTAATGFFIAVTAEEVVAVCGVVEAVEVGDGKGTNAVGL